MKVPQRRLQERGDSPWSATPPPRRRRRLRSALLAWYGAQARQLRIRSTADPWSTLVAEVMAQQTQIARADEAWVDFMGRFPSPPALAGASTAAVLGAWAGLGYNRRALALQSAARRIVAEHGGRVPADVATLERLPGIGPYTARAVAAAAYGVPVAAIDTNVRRWMTRMLGGERPPAVLQAAADALVPAHDAATWHHASMDLGALVCRARRPRCPECPVRMWCASAGRAEATAPHPRASPRARPVGVPPLRFEATSRWLRGRIVAQLLAADDGAWVRLPAAIGEHGPGRVVAAIMALERDGLLERRPDGAVRLPSGP